jgi:hypothetical protein
MQYLGTNIPESRERQDKYQPGHEIDARDTHSIC